MHLTLPGNINLRLLRLTLGHQREDSWPNLTSGMHLGHSPGGQTEASPCKGLSSRELVVPSHRAGISPPPSLTLGRLRWLCCCVQREIWELTISGTYHVRKCKAAGGTEVAYQLVLKEEALPDYLGGHSVTTGSLEQ